MIDDNQIIYVIRTQLKGGVLVDRVFKNHTLALLCSEKLKDANMYYEMFPIEEKKYVKPNYKPLDDTGFIL